MLRPLAVFVLVAAACQSAARAEEVGVEADRIRAIASEMLADARTRSSLAESEAVVTHDGTRFRIATPDGRFVLRPLGEIQLRYLANLRDGADDDDAFGFQTRRSRVRLDGTAFERIDFRVLTAFSRSSGRLVLEDLWAAYRVDDHWRVRVGQYRVPFLREEMVAGRYQLALERSLVNEIFNQGFSQAIEARWRAEDVQVTASFSDGFYSRNTEFNDDKDGPFDRGAGADWGLTARLDWKPMGGWGQFRDLTSPPDSDPAILVGASIHGEGGDADPGGQYTSLHATADLSVELDGFSAFAAFVWRRGDPDGGPISDDFGVVAQAAWYLPDTDWELYGRYDVYLPDTDLPDDDPFHSVTVGANWYIHGQAARFTIDVVWFPQDAGGTDFRTLTRSTVIGFLGTEDANETLLRAQFQLLF